VEGHEQEGAMDTSRRSSAHTEPVGTDVVRPEVVPPEVVRTGVVVGVDGSLASFDAVDLAARAAAARGRSLRVVHAFPTEGALREQAERIVDTAVARAVRVAPGVPVHGEIRPGHPAAVLRECARDAALVVVGDRGLGGFRGLLLGSVAVHLTGHVACPVLVARGRSGPRRPVLLGVDGSPANDPAVGFAFEEAALWRVPLVALHAWTHPVPAGPGDMLPLVYDTAEVAAEETRLTAEALAGWQEKYPDVVVRREVRHGPARTMLIDASRDAQLVVVGTRGRGGFPGLLLGSVSHAVLHHAACPVAMVPHGRPAG
jgi:nucleotide-binding universal stress UspA family protein